MKYGKAMLEPHSESGGASDATSHFTYSRFEQSSMMSCQASPVAERKSTSTACGNV